MFVMNENNNSDSPMGIDLRRAEHEGMFTPLDYGWARQL